MIRNLVLSGCGVKIFLYLGILKYLDEHNILQNITRYVGCSAGSLILFFVSLKYSCNELEELLINIKLDELVNIDTEAVLNFFDNLGMSNLDHAERILRIVLKAKTGKSSITFEELNKFNDKELVIVATNIHKYQTVYFSYKNNPDMDVVTAVLMSLCIPILFNPIKYKDEYYVDGGITCHYPIEYIPESELLETFGVIVTPDYCILKDCVDNDEMLCLTNFKQNASINSIEDYIFSILGCPLFRQIQDSYKKHSKNTLLILNNKNPVDFDLPKEEKKHFVELGYEKITEFFPKFKKYLEETKPKNQESKFKSIGVQTD